MNPISVENPLVLGKGIAVETKSNYPVFIGAFILLHAIVCFFLLNPSGLEPISDEAVYVTLAKSLATTGEYKLISLPGDPDHTKYPVLYPWLLSWIWRVSPDFPANVSLLRWVSIVFAAAFLGVLALLMPRLLEGNKKRAVLIIGLCAVHPALIASSTAILSESAYLFFSCLALWVVVELDHRAESILFLVLFSVCLAFSFYVRTIGIALIAAVTCDYLIRRKWRRIFWLLALTLIFLSPWLYWTRTHNEASRFPEYTFYTNYLSDFRQLAEAGGLSAFLVKNALYLFIGIPKLLVYPFQTDLHLITILTAWTGLPVLALLLIGILRSFRSKTSRVVLFYVLTYLSVLGFWPYPAHERLLLPLLPFLDFFIFVEVFHITERLRNQDRPNLAFRKARSLGLALLPVALGGACLVIFGLHTYQLISNVRQAVQQFESRNRDMLESFDWLEKETRPSDHLMAYLDPVYYHHTQRKVAPMSFDPRGRLSHPKFLDTPIQKHEIKYLVTGELDFGVFTPDVVQAMGRELRRVIEGREGLTFEQVFRSTDNKYQIYRIIDEKQRSSWGQ